MSDTIIGIGELSVAQGKHTLITLGLGSCVGLVLYDSIKRIGGMAHIMLPKSPPGQTSAKYADIAFAELMRQMIKAGANPRVLTAKMAGGAHMFSASVNTDTLRVGERNLEMCNQLLAQQPVRVVAQDTGGTVGRTIMLDCASGDLLVRTAYPRIEKII